MRANNSSKSPGDQRFSMARNGRQSQSVATIPVFDLADPVTPELAQDSEGRVLAVLVQHDYGSKISA
jgi:hypothetical protein